MRGDGGAMAVAMSAVVAIVAVSSVAVASIGALYGARTQAANAADAAALAAAVASYPPAEASAPVERARSAATANGAILVACRCPRDWSLAPRTVEVVAAIRASVPIFGEVTVKSSARAEFDPGDWLGP